MPDAPASSWASARLRRSTHARLAALRDRLMNHYVAGKLPGDMADGLSVDALVNRLLDQHARHSARRRRQLASRRASAPG